MVKTSAPRLAVVVRSDLRFRIERRRAGAWLSGGVYVKVEKPVKIRIHDTDAIHSNQTQQLKLFRRAVLLPKPPSR